MRERSRQLPGKPAFLLNTFPKASPLNVCILLCMPVTRFPEQRSAQEGNSLSAQGGSQPQEKRSRGATAQHDSRIREPPPHGTKRISITQPSNSRSTLRTTGNIRFLLTWERIPECMPENSPRNNSEERVGNFLYSFRSKVVEPIFPS